MKIREVIDYLNSQFLPVYQESYDNAGFLVGDSDLEITGALVTLDVTPAVIDEAIATKSNLIISHHPMIFGGMKRITMDSESGKMVIKLLQHGISVYSAHTNLDNLDWGVNGILSEKLSLKDCKILRPIEGVLYKLVTFVPSAHAEELRQALFATGAGSIGRYDCCSFNNNGTGTFRASTGCNPFCGKIDELHEEPETRIEVIYEKRIERKLIERLLEVHPYEEPAYDCIQLSNKYMRIGSGMIGKLDSPLPLMDFLSFVKSILNIPVLRCSHFDDDIMTKRIQKVAVCGGAGSFLIGDAKAKGADIFLTGDLKYHDFQSAENAIILCDIGHFESEQFAKDIFYNVISKKFSNFACRIAEQSKGFIRYI